MFRFCLINYVVVLSQADYVMLAGIGDTAELINGGKKGAIDDLEEGELEGFITKLGIRAYAEQQIIRDEQDETSSEPPKKEKKKAKSSKMKDDSQSDVKNTVKPITEGTKTPVKSKELGKPTGKRAKQKHTNLFEFIPRQTLLIKLGGKWFDIEYTSESTSVAQSESLVLQYKALAQKLYENEIALYKNKKNFQKGANSAWMKSVVSTGTLTDRMAAMTVLIQDAPIHSLEHVENLVSLVKKKGSRRQGLMALDTLKELLLTDLLPKHRKLHTFSQHPFEQLEEKASGNRDSRDRRLILWYFEHLLKLQVIDFAAALDELARDTVQATKMRSLTTAYELLCNQPEQEKVLLVQIVNKLGDPEYKIASKASHLLETVLHKHPNMKTVVCFEVERLMFRPNISSKAQYYAACFLNQVILSHEEADLAAKLITIYITFFNACVKKKDIESKMLSALLTGVNRAYPYAKIGDDDVCKQLDTLFKVVHIVKFNTAVQALMLLFQVMDSQQTISDRYYVALYSHSQFVDDEEEEMYQDLEEDVDDDRIAEEKLVDTDKDEKIQSVKQCQMKPTASFSFIAASKKVSLQDEEEEMYQDLEEDVDDDRIAEEKLVDTDKDEKIQSVKQCQMKPTASWVHHQNLEGSLNKVTYDPMNRNPLYCGADHTALWELQKLSFHFHPSVALFAKTLLQGEFILYTGDPLQDFTLIRFLDRFVFRNPKQTKGKKNTDATVMQPKYRRTFNNIQSLPVNCEEYLAKEESQIPVDEVFFYRYFKKRDAEKRWKKPNRNEDNESVEDVDDDEFERVLDVYEGDSFFTEFKDDDLDFAGNVMPKSKKGRDKDGEDSDDDDEDDLDDEEVSLGSMDEDFEDELEDEGGEFMDIEEKDDDDDDAGAQPAKKKKKGKMEDQSVFASAEEFGCLLEENTSLKFDNNDMNAMANTDKADVKQLKWEVKRNDWIHGRDVKTLRRKKAMFNKRKFGKAQKLKSVKRKK
ncbi:CCAAT/enhancer-binding protein zeta [Sinocyclocheilus grahami]|uniref:CCAAT/enhancer-binding protein zeta n=1 Tax=Sinocyclocheilus grahami TaxID=75366 RepID=UPI0007AD50CA|nr:PREDICTED: CCAAT/enhancer-binding protein zeta [Sinocyclocheilus grahami]